MSKKNQSSTPSSKPKVLVQDKDRIGQILRYIREIRGLTCPDIARKYNISAPAIYDYEMGRSFPRYRNAKELFSALRIDINIFWEHLYLAESDVSPELIARNIIRESDEQHNNNCDVGKVLRAIRHIRGISAERISDEYGISEQCIYGYEQGKCFPKRKNLEVLCCALNINPELISQYVNFAQSGDSVIEAHKIIRDSGEKSMQAESTVLPPTVPEDPYERMMVEAFREGIKNLTQQEKTVLFRSIVNFTTQKCHKEFYHK